MRCPIFAFCFAGLLGLLPTLTFAADLEGRVVSVGRDLSLTLSGGETLFLGGVVAPEGGTAAATVQDLLEHYMDALVGRTVRADILNPEPDRYGRIAAIVSLDEATMSLQASLLSMGLVLVYTHAPEVADMFLPYEDAARRTGEGVWRLAPPGRCAERLGTFESGFRIVRGRVYDVASVRGTFYLNFDENWREDFTIRVPRRMVRNFDEDALKALEGAQVEVRGWVYPSGGPMIDVFAPTHIRTLAGDTALGCE